MYIFKCNKESSDNYDPNLPVMVNKIKEHINTNDDDFLILLVGDTGSGKSNLGLHILNIYQSSNPSLDCLAMNTSTFAVALKTISKKGINDRILFYDESNINKRSSSSKVNRDMIDLYMAIRGLNIFHMWCNPSLDMIDKHFIQERIKAIILCPSKTKGARVYFYFKQSAILDILKKYDTLTINTLTRVRRKYALYRGWFREYKGILKQPYLEIKGNRMIEKVEIFHDKYAEVSDKEYYSLLDIAKQLGCHYTTVQKYVNLGIDQQLLKENEQYKKNFNGSLAFTKDSIDIIKSMASKTYQNWTSNMGKHLRKPNNETA